MPVCQHFLLVGASCSCIACLTVHLALPCLPPDRPPARLPVEPTSCGCLQCGLSTWFDCCCRSCPALCCNTPPPRLLQGCLCLPPSHWQPPSHPPGVPASRPTPFGLAMLVCRAAAPQMPAPTSTSTCPPAPPSASTSCGATAPQVQPVLTSTTRCVWCGKRRRWRPPLVQEGGLARAAATRRAGYDGRGLWGGGWGLGCKCLDGRSAWLCCAVVCSVLPLATLSWGCLPQAPRLPLLAWALTRLPLGPGASVGARAACLLLDTADCVVAGWRRQEAGNWPLL